MATIQCDDSKGGASLSRRMVVRELEKRLEPLCRTIERPADFFNAQRGTFVSLAEDLSIGSIPNRHSPVESRSDLFNKLHRGEDIVVGALVVESFGARISSGDLKLPAGTYSVVLKGDAIKYVDHDGKEFGPQSYEIRSPMQTTSDKKAAPMSMIETAFDRVNALVCVYVCKCYWWGCVCKRLACGDVIIFHW